MTAQYCTFELGEMLIGIEVAGVREVLVDPDVTPVPLAPPGVRGLLSRRGEIVTVVDSHRRLGVSAPERSRPQTHVIIELDGETASLPVDAEGEVIELEEGELQPIPGTVAPALRRMLDGVAPLRDGRLMLALRAERTISREAG